MIFKTKRITSRKNNKALINPNFAIKNAIYIRAIINLIEKKSFIALVINLKIKNLKKGLKLPNKIFRVICLIQFNLQTINMNSRFKCTNKPR